MKTGRNIKILRLIRGIDQIAAAEHAFMDAKTLRKIENGELSSNEKQLEELSKLLGISITCLRNFDFDLSLSLFEKIFHLQQIYGYSDEEVLKKVSLNPPSIQE